MSATADNLTAPLPRSLVLTVASRETRHGRKWVTCKNCGQALAEIFEGDLYRKQGRTTDRIPDVHGVQLQCSRCGLANDTL